MNTPGNPVHFSQKLLSYLLSLLLVGQPVFPAVAATVTSTSNTQIDKAGNGVPVINIATPNAAGISHNTYNDYNVGKEGLILNNATEKLNTTQLGGLIQGNPNLKAGQEARGIINEVTGTQRSQLQGYTEVAGKAANVMVANPYGITCSGCGFINTPNATLTTGKPVFDASGNLQALSVTRGSITVDGQGLDGAASEAVLIIARATEINAQLHAKNLNVVAGANRVDASGGISATNGEGPAPAIAIDTGALGGMYANRIRLVSSETGVGVNLGNLNARQGDITVDASGKLTLKNSLASGAMSLKGKDIGLSGDNKATESITVSSQGDIALDHGTLSSDQDLRLSASGQLIQRDGQLTAGNDIALSGQRISQAATGKADAARNIIINSGATETQGTFTAGRQIGVSGGDWRNSGIFQGQSLNLNGATIENTGRFNSTGALDIAAQSFSHWGELNAGGNITLAINDSLLNNGNIISGDRLTLFANRLVQNGLASGVNGLTFSANTLTTANPSVTHSDGAIGLYGQTLNLGGEISANNAITLQSQRLKTQSGSQIQTQNNLTIDAQQAELSGTLASKGVINIATQGDLHQTGNSNGAQVVINAAQFTNSGAISAPSLKITSQKVVNSGLLQGSQTLSLLATLLENQQSGMIYSAGSLALSLPTINNSGVITSDSTLTLTGDALINRGEISGDRVSLQQNTIGNAAQGVILAKHDGQITAQSLNNGGTLAASDLTLRAATLDHSGLLQGDNTLFINGDSLTFTASSRTLTAGELSVNGDRFTSDGVMQGQNARVDVTSWLHDGSLLATKDLWISAANDAINHGDLFSQGNTRIAANAFTNTGSLLSAGAMTVTGERITNSGNMQGDTLTLRQSRVDNQGTLIGLNGLTLTGPSLVLVNGLTGSLLTSAALNVQADAVTNGGLWQGLQILLNAGSLNHSGAIQSADTLQLNIAGAMNGAAGNKISANGNAAIEALALTNSGQWIAKNLTLKAGSLSNGGDITGVDKLSATLTHTFAQQQNGRSLSADALEIDAGAVDNRGQIQGNATRLTASALQNSGRIQGDNTLALGVAGDATNAASGVLLSQNALTLSAANVFNDGIIQGNGNTTLSSQGQLRNAGQLLSAAIFTLNAAQFLNNGAWQADQLRLNAAAATNNGTVLATRNASLSGQTLLNAGTLQGADLLVNYRDLTNRATVLGTHSLTVNADNLQHETGASLFSGGDLRVNAINFSQSGQVVALGNVMLELIDAFTSQATLAAGNTLSVSSQGAITNQNVMQGQAVNLSAGGQLTNNGQLTTGYGSSTLNGSSIVLNSAGTLQAGGDVTLNSGSDITVNGFTGTAGSLTLNAATALINTALLYAAGNMRLFADSIQNLYGDILAGNSLWIQKDAAGNASREVINTSGTIETRQGDITIATGHLLNQRDGLRFSESSYDLPTIPGAGQSFWEISVDDLMPSEVGVRKEVQGCPNNDFCEDARFIEYFYAPWADQLDKKIALSRTQTDVVSDGSAARISAGHDLNIAAGTLENLASNLLAGNDARLSGTSLNNQSWQAATTTNYLLYSYKFRDNNIATDTIASMMAHLGEPGVYEPVKPILTYLLVGPITETVAGEAFRAVIQAGGNISANFTSDISNTAASAFTGGSGSTITTPTLNPLSGPVISGGIQQAELIAADTADVTSPQWRDALSDALESISGGTAFDAQHGRGGDTSAYPLPSGNNGYFVPATDPGSPYLITLNPKLDNLGRWTRPCSATCIPCSGCSRARSRARPAPRIPTAASSSARRTFWNVWALTPAATTASWGMPRSTPGMCQTPS
nr:filamentous hemagglutinin N-terminal domain-containing protein [Atlantibacter subterranea]